MRMLLLVPVLLLVMSGLIIGQVSINNFDSSVADSVFEILKEGDKSEVKLEDDHADFVEGTGSLLIDTKIGDYHQWGSYTTLKKIIKPDDE